MKWEVEVAFVAVSWSPGRTNVSLGPFHTALKKKGNVRLQWFSTCPGLIVLDMNTTAKVGLAETA